ncbi:MAG: 4Fe-4S binding protein [Methanothermobacter sp.]|nr:4Fe-4S binding protein [Methanothermobacter sp.]
MDITFKKSKNALKEDLQGRYMELEAVEGQDLDIGKCKVKGKFITISPECIRCNLCAEECPVDAIANAKSTRQAKVLENCVKCEICAQTCPIRCINVVESIATIDEDVKYHLKDLKIPHRILRMKNIKIDSERCKGCGTCIRFCPTGAIKLEDETATIDTSICIGCGACANVCEEGVIKLERELGPVIRTKELLIDQEACVACQICEENCPTEAIRLEDEELIFSDDKCILCEVCSTKCPVGALKLKRLSHES